MTTTNLQLWQPPDKADVSKADAYKQHLDESNDLAVTELIAEQRDRVMRRQLSVSGKFMDAIEDEINDLDSIGNKKDRRTIMRSLAETMKIVSDVQSKAAMFDHVAKPTQREEISVKHSLFAPIAPVRRLVDVTGT